MKQMKIIKKMMKNDEENNKKIEEIVKENKNLKKKISELKQFLVSLEENMNKKDSELKESMSQFSKIQSNEEQINIKLEEIKKEINDKLNSFNKPEEKKIEETFYGCNFTDENYIVLYNEELKYFKINVNLLNNGNLPWPINSYVYGESQDGIWKFNKITINKDKEILPNESLQFPLSIIIPKNIPIEKGEIILPLNLYFVDKSVQIKQNTLKIKLIMKKLEKSESQRNILSKNPRVQTHESINRDEPHKSPQNEINKINSNQTDFENSSSKVINGEPDNKPETNENEEEEKRKKELEEKRKKELEEKRKKELEEKRKKEEEEKRKKEEEEKRKKEEEEKKNKEEEEKRKKEEEENIISEDRFNKIKNKLEEDYNLSNVGWSDKELKEKIQNNLNDDLNNLLGTDEDEAISKIVEMIGEELLELI